MARTMQDIVNRARVPLNDAAKVRYSDADLLAGANDGILILRRKRPDLFFGNYLALATAELGLGTPMPVDDEYFYHLCMYTTAWAERRDDEDALQSRAAAFYALFDSELKS